MHLSNPIFGWLALAAWLLNAGSAVADPALALQERTEREAHDVLDLWLRTDAGTLHPCILPAEWLTSRPVYASLAKKYLGSTVNADLLAPESMKRPSDIIDPAKGRPKIFVIPRKKILAEFAALKILKKELL